MQTAAPPFLEIIEEQKNQINEYKQMLKSSEVIFEDQMSNKMTEFEGITSNKDEEIKQLEMKYEKLVKEAKEKDIELDKLKGIHKTSIEQEKDLRKCKSEIQELNNKRLLDSSEHIRKYAQMESDYQIKLKMQIEEIKVATRESALHDLNKDATMLNSKYQELCLLYERTTKKLKQISQELVDATHKMTKLENELSLATVATQMKSKDFNKHLEQNKTMATKFNQLEMTITQMHDEIEILKIDKITISTESLKTKKEMESRINALQLIIDDRSSQAEHKLKLFLDHRTEMEGFLIDALTHVKKEIGHDFTGEWGEKEKILKYMFAKIKGII